MISTKIITSFVVQIQPDILLSIPTNIEICSGLPVNAILSANVPSQFSWFVTLDNPNVSGEGINMAQRCMDAGDNDHILISNTVYQYVNEMEIPGLEFDDWGSVLVKHGAMIHMWTAYGPGFGRKEFPHWRGTKKIDFKK